MMQSEHHEFHNRRSGSDQVPRFIRDPKDDYLIACVLAGKADFLVSGDEHVLYIKAAKTVKMVTAKQFRILREFRKSAFQEHPLVSTPNTVQ